MYISYALQDGSTLVHGGPVDEYGRPVDRTKSSHPYCYDSFVQWRGGANEEANGTIYTDRLLSWDMPKHDRLCVKHFGNRHQYWSDRDPDKIESFLRDWLDDQALKLILVMECCNQSSGYPTWRLDYASGTAVASARKVDQVDPG